VGTGRNINGPDAKVEEFRALTRDAMKIMDDDHLSSVLLKLRTPNNNVTSEINWSIVSRKSVRLQTFQAYKSGMTCPGVILLGGNSGLKLPRAQNAI
jgi:hypothetical protein